MPLTCSHCSRINPAEALFCYHDGVALGDPSRQRGLTDPSRQRFAMPFVFPSGKACHSFDELALAILDHWADARTMLDHGVFGNFLAGLGRGDLSMAAREAAAFPDRDRGLDQMLNALPASVLQPPRLSVEPGQLNLGTMRPGQDARFDLHLANQGSGLLHGTIHCEECPWLSLGDPAAGLRKKMFQFLNEATLAVHIAGKSLRAGKQPQEGRILLESTGGTRSVVVTVDVPVQPFAEGVLAGALTPRKIAEKARKLPREAAELFARGTVAKWYAANGWTYPVQEPAASGVAAVQQFFEALGLTTPPKVGINVAEIRFEGRSGEILRSSVRVRAEEKRPVYAHAVSDAPWLKVNEVAFDGRTAMVHLRVPDVPDRPGETLNARLTITSNGRQRFVVPVSLNVTGRAGGGRSRPPLPIDVLEVVPEPSSRDHDIEVLEEVLPVVEHLPEEPQPPRRRGRRRYEDDAEFERASSHSKPWPALAVLPVVFILLGLLVTLGRDLHAWLGPRWSGGGEESFADVPQVLSLQFHDEPIAVRLAARGGAKPGPGLDDQETVPGIWEPSMRFGLTMLQADARGQRKKLTYEEKGLTNNTCVRLDGNEWLFGERPFRRLDGGPSGDWPGRWLERNARLDRPLRDGRKSVWVYDKQKIHVAQTVGLVPGEQSGKLDTCLIHYRIDNLDKLPHVIGLRFLLDTFIGGNDGVPFLIPGGKQLCSTSMEFRRSQDVPDFIQAREREDLANPGTIAHIQLKIPGMEAPARVTLGAWPNPALGFGALQEKTLWEVPVLPIHSIQPGDSAVVIYWAEKTIAAGTSREVAFAYGLGNVASGEGGGRLALTIGGAFIPNGEFTLTAYVNNPLIGQTLTLDLPDEFSLVGGKARESVPALPADASSRNSPVTWKVRAGSREGKFTIRVRSSNGVSQTQPVTIRARGIFGN
jgi:hypothetical protein